MTTQLILNNKDKPQFVPEDVPAPKRKSRVVLAQQAAAKYAPRKRLPGEAMPPGNTWSQGCYMPGDGDVITPRRAGSDHSIYKSKGFLT